MFRTLSSRHAMHWLVSSAFTACFYYWDNLTYYVEDDDTISWPVLMLFVCILLSFFMVGYVLFYSFKNQAGFSVLTPFFLLIVIISKSHVTPISGLSALANLFRVVAMFPFDVCNTSILPVCLQLSPYRVHNFCSKTSATFRHFPE